MIDSRELLRGLSKKIRLYNEVEADSFSDEDG